MGSDHDLLRQLLCQKVKKKRGKRIRHWGCAQSIREHSRCLLLHLLLPFALLVLYVILTLIIDI